MFLNRRAFSGQDDNYHRVQIAITMAVLRRLSLRRPHAGSAPELVIHLPLSVLLNQDVVSTAAAETSTNMADVDQCSCSVCVETYLRKRGR